MYFEMRIIFYFFFKKRLEIYINTLHMMSYIVSMKVLLRLKHIMLVTSSHFVSMQNSMEVFFIQRLTQRYTTLLGIVSIYISI